MKLPNPTALLRATMLAGAISVAAALGGTVMALADSAMNIPVLAQQDPAWGGARLGASPTDSIASSGCAITAVTMLLHDYGMDTNPGAFNAWLTPNGGYALWDNLVWDAVTRYSGGWVAFSGWLGPDLTTIVNQIDAAQPVVAEARLGQNQPFVLIRLHDGGRAADRRPVVRRQRSLQRSLRRSRHRHRFDPHLQAGRLARDGRARLADADLHCRTRRTSIAITSASAARGTVVRYCEYFFRKATIARFCSGPRSTMRARPCNSTHHSRRQSST